MSHITQKCYCSSNEFSEARHRKWKHRWPAHLAAPLRLNHLKQILMDSNGFKLFRKCFTTCTGSTWNRFGWNKYGKCDMINMLRPPGDLKCDKYDKVSCPPGRTCLATPPGLVQCICTPSCPQHWNPVIFCPHIDVWTYDSPFRCFNLGDGVL